MKAYVIAQIDVQDPVRYADYVKLTPGTIEQFGGRFIARGGRAEKLEGDIAVNRVVVLEFPSYQQAKAWYESDGYRVAMAIRRSSSKGSLILVEGTP
ncbi:MAG TPA: DUF1330 domain-containing protein [Steroidobacteraceae bacterium]|nr:DUF1330 domain-containing protein [Steroidobacteraceae bacterium]